MLSDATHLQLKLTVPYLEARLNQNVYFVDVFVRTYVDSKTLGVTNVLRLFFF